MLRYFIIFKPYQVLSQFSSEGGKKTLADFFNVPKNVYPVGRLDYDSEGLLILTNDTQLNHRLLSPSNKHERKYWVQVEGEINDEAIIKLSSGVTISIDGKAHTTLPAKASLMKMDPDVPERVPPIRFRKNVPVSWISLSLIEGKNRQVRRMTASVGYPTLRLIRYSIERITIQGMQSGDIKEIDRNEIFEKIFK